MDDVRKKKERFDMVKTKDEILASISTRIGEDNSDEAITLLEDISDTLNDLEAKSKDTTDWQKKYTENDQMWRERYRERFETTAENIDEGIDNRTHVMDRTGENNLGWTPKTFDDLFEITK